MEVMEVSGLSTDSQRSSSATERLLGRKRSEDLFKTGCRNRKCFCAHTYEMGRAAKSSTRKVDLTDQLSGLHGGEGV